MKEMPHRRCAHVCVCVCVFGFNRLMFPLQPENYTTFTSAVIDKAVSFVSWRIHATIWLEVSCN